MTPRLGVNIDHIATLRQLRNTPYPSLVEAARIVEEAGGELITIHLREDRRHIQDQDVKDLRQSLRVPMNLEMAATEAMTKFAIKIGPEWVCLVPEKRSEVTTEGGLDLARGRKRIEATMRKLQKAGIKISLFVEPSIQAVKLAADLGAEAVELHTGTFCIATQLPDASKKGSRVQAKVKSELERIKKAGQAALSAGLRANAGHGFDYENVRPVAELTDARDKSGLTPLIEEYNIGHVIVCRAAIVGLDRAVREMVSAIRAP